MSLGHIYLSYLEKNIEKIDFYKDEEEKVLKKISNQLEECNKRYHSSNTTYLSNKAANIKGNINNIKNKRIKYNQVLKTTIERYKEMSTSITESMK